MEAHITNSKIIVGDHVIGIVQQDWLVAGRGIVTQYAACVSNPVPGAPRATVRQCFDTVSAAVDFWVDHMERRVGHDGITLCGDVLHTRDGRISRRICGDCSRADHYESDGCNRLIDSDDH
jgi:hypothetical protein